MLHRRNQRFDKRAIINLALFCPTIAANALPPFCRSPALLWMTRSLKGPRRRITEYYALSHLARIGAIAFILQKTGIMQIFTYA
jgi:hypothetical protein